jgi:hypothetical protein
MIISVFRVQKVILLILGELGFFFVVMFIRVIMIIRVIRVIWVFRVILLLLGVFGLLASLWL